MTFPVGKISGQRLEICEIEYSTESEGISASIALAGDFLEGDKPIRFHFYSFDIESIVDRGFLPAPPEIGRRRF